mgnify:CR=1 FL=1
MISIKEDDDCFVGGGGERETENKKLEYNFMESKIN